MDAGHSIGTLTVLFTDLVGSTELMSRLGEATFDEFRRDHFSRLREVIDAHAGTEVKTTGDGLLVTFGSAVAAVRCAVALQQDTQRQAHWQNLPLAMRISLALGDVSQEDDDIYGTPVVEAARLVGQAEAHQILATALIPAVAGARAGARYTQIGSAHLRGLPDPVDVYQIHWDPFPAEVPLPVPLAAVAEVGFVARDSELSRVQALWKRVEGGERHVVLVGGEPGVGKTRLTAELAREVHATGALVLAGRCDEDLGVPYQPFVGALRHLVDNVSVAALPARLGRLAGELTRLSSEIGVKLPGLPPPLRSDPETERYRLFDAVAAWLGALSERQPTMLVLDDLQWAARPTLLLLRHVIRSPEPMRLMIMGTYRDTELSHTHPLAELLADLRRDGAAERVDLGGLTADGVAALIESAAGHELEDHDVELARAIHVETEGNPFFVVEILRHLAETGAVFRVDQRWTRKVPVSQLGIPDGIREVIGRRLARLSDEANRILRLAAAAGEEFETAVLRAAGNFDEETMIAALEETTAARLVHPVSGPPPRHRFAHALVRAALYDELSVPRRAVLHRRVGEAIEVVHAHRIDDHLPALAHHFALADVGGDTRRAVRYAARAGDRALAMLAHDETVTYYQQALDLLDASDSPRDESQRCDLLIGLGEGQRLAGSAAHRETLLRAARLARRLGDPDRLSRAAVANHRGFFSLANEVDAERVEILESAVEALDPSDSPLRARLLVTLASELVFSRDHTRRHGLAAEGLEMARRVGDPITLGDVLARGYVPTFTSLDVAALRRHTADLERVAKQLGDPALDFWASTWGFLTAVLVGDLQAAAGLIGTSTAVAEDVGQPFMRWIATFGRSHLHRILGRLGDAEQLAWEGLELARAAGAPDAFRMFGIQLFWIRYDQGRLAEVVDLLVRAVSRDPPPPLILAAYALAMCELDQPDDARRAFDQLAAQDFALPFAPLFAATILADVAATLDAVDEAAVLYRHLLPHRGLLGTNGAATTGRVDHYLALLADTLGRFHDAEDHFRAALEWEQRGQAEVFLARTRLEYARFLLRRHPGRDPDATRRLLDDTLAAAQRHQLHRIDRHAQDLSMQVAPPPADSGISGVPG